MHHPWQGAGAVAGAAPEEAPGGEGGAGSGEHGPVGGAEPSPDDGPFPAQMNDVDNHKPRQPVLKQTLCVLVCVKQKRAVKAENSVSRLKVELQKLQVSQTF